jgi:hypothetical protein
MIGDGPSRRDDGLSQWRARLEKRLHRHAPGFGTQGKFYKLKRCIWVHVLIDEHGASVPADADARSVKDNEKLLI